jgi:hypothetical protein
MVMKPVPSLLTALTLSCAHSPYSLNFKIPPEKIFVGQENAALDATSFQDSHGYGCKIETYLARKYLNRADFGKENRSVTYLRAEFRCTANHSRYFSLYELIDYDQDGMIDLQCQRQAYDYQQEDEVWKQERVCKSIVKSLIY